MSTERTQLKSVSYAKNPNHERFIRAFKGANKRRYHVAFLVAAGLTGVAELRAAIEAELGHPKYLDRVAFNERPRRTSSLLDRGR